MWEHVLRRLSLVCLAVKPEKLRLTFSRAGINQQEAEEVFEEVAQVSPCLMYRVQVDIQAAHLDARNSYWS
jgi:hypothetical protein